MKNVLIIFFALSAVLLAQSNKTHIAILKLQGHGISQDDGITLTERLQNELVKTGCFSVIERREMENILHEQGFQMSACTSDECAVEAGRLLNVQEIVAGSIGKVGSLYTVALRLISIETGEIIKTVTEDCQCPIERVLTHSMHNVALKLAGRLASDGISELEEGNGDLFIKTEPSGAKIFLDGEDTHKFTPATLQDLAAGKHFIKVIKGNLIGSKNVSVKANNIVTEKIQLEQARGNLKIYSDPPEARVMIDNHFYGKTPLIVNNLSVGIHKVTFKLERYETVVKMAQVSFNRFNKINVRLKKMGSIEILSSPPGAKILIDGLSYGTTPKTIYTFPSGHHKVSLRKKDYATDSREIDVRAESTIRISAFLKKYAELSVKSVPTGVLVFVDNKLKGKTPLVLKLEPEKPLHIKLSKHLYSDWQRTLILSEGEFMQINTHMKKQKGRLVIYKIPEGAFITIDNKTFLIDKREIPLPVGNYSATISRAGFFSKSFSFDIYANQKKAIYADLDKKTRSGAFFRSLFFPGWGQSFQDKGFRAFIFKLGFLGAAGGSYFYTKEYLKAQKNNADMNKINSLKKMRDLFYKSLAGVWAVNLLDALILPPAWDNNVHISARLENKRVLANLNMRW